MCAVAVVCASCTVQQSVYTTTRIPFQFLQKRIPKSRWAIQRAYASRKTSYAHSAHMIIIRSQSFFLCPFNTTAFEMGYLKFKWLLLVAGLDVSLLVCCCCCCCRCYSAVLLLSASWPFSLSLSLTLIRRGWFRDFIHSMGCVLSHFSVFAHNSIPPLVCKNHKKNLWIWKCNHNLFIVFTLTWCTITIIFCLDNDGDNRWVEHFASSWP